MLIPDTLYMYILHRLKVLTAPIPFTLRLDLCECWLWKMSVWKMTITTCGKEWSSSYPTIQRQGEGCKEGSGTCFSWTWLTSFATDVSWRYWCKHSDFKGILILLNHCNSRIKCLRWTFTIWLGSIRSTRWPLIARAASEKPFFPSLAWSTTIALGTGVAA